MQHGGLCGRLCETQTTMEMAVAMTSSTTSTLMGR